ncbi:peptidoglycan-binding domain-containing protein [Herbivorax sp. ANBcel31]|uniref:peptidoglycan-binding domain-containing protein n=1 Tax=Herbivorax sp. ANBcel31 TaxID=3069754 RepID=UPI0027B1A652|nr:peptidoglycan-binding domain-containing protein [Herbivorax sp. ANBcel31]MDQ2085766.1 peptidoglycan-binding domain-containing protein [Herbivorax sp. ANBcel31]
MIIYLLNEETGEMVPQATRIDESSGIVTATLPNTDSSNTVSAQTLASNGMLTAQNWGVTHEQSRKIVVSNVQSQNRAVNVAFVIDSEHSDQDALDTFETNITSTLLGLMGKTNIRVVFLESRDGENIKIDQVSHSRTNNRYAREGLRTRIAHNFNNIEPVNKTLDPDGLLGQIQSGLVSGSEMLDEYTVQGADYNEYALFYTRHSGYFSDANSIITELGNTTGLVVGQATDESVIAYNDSDVEPLVNFLFEGGNADVPQEDIGKPSWLLMQGADNDPDDVTILQKLLVTHGYLEFSYGKDFGTFDSSTKKAVEGYQRDNRNLEIDGIVGKNTWMELVSWDTDDMLWDYEKGQPNRETWTYRYTLNNLFYHGQSPDVELTSPTVETRLKPGEKLEIIGSGRDCHHIALFINGEWVKTEFDNTELYTSIHLDHDIDAHGIYDIQLKGRSVPNGDDDTTLASTEIVEAIVPINFAKQDDDALIRVTQVGTTIYFHVDVGFDDRSEWHGQTSLNYKDLAIEGFKLWEGNVEYDGFDYQIKINLNELSDDEVTDMVMEGGRGGEFLYGRIYMYDYDMIYTFIHSNALLIDSVRYEHIGIDNWNVNSSSSIYLGVEDEPTANMFRNTAAHEFGHALGLEDAYIHFTEKIKKNDNILPDSVSINGVEHNDIMWGYDRADTCVITDLNRKMVLDAFVENQIQGYRDEFVKDEYYGLNRYVHKNRHIP